MAHCSYNGTPGSGESGRLHNSLRKAVEVWQVTHHYLNASNWKKFRFNTKIPSSAMFYETEIGVNWAAIGPVSPDRAEKFAKALLKVAKTARKRISEAKRKGHRVHYPDHGKG